MLYKGKEYTIQEGKRGGKFFIDDNGKKHYIKSVKKKATKIIPAKKYTALIEKYNDKGALVDDFKEWTTAHSETEALNHFRAEYPNLEITIYKVENLNDTRVN